MAGQCQGDKNFWSPFPQMWRCQLNCPPLCVFAGLSDPHSIAAYRFRMIPKATHVCVATLHCRQARRAPEIGNVSPAAWVNSVRPVGVVAARSRRLIDLPLDTHHAR
jgi:hypothetical protein